MRKHGPPPGIGHQYTSDDVVVPRAQLEAYQEAANTLAFYHGDTPFEGTRAANALAALRAAGIDLEDKTETALSEKEE